ncbi:hypothetical protein AR820_25925 [Salmonella enterica subsp. enterica serovar Typhimurium var. 5-]|uniref:Uncharacterized protein n=1 Tax=Salmonella enterica subsp. enterica serovar Typhimurium var. 5- TaxID=1620419 RepID=A0A5W1E9Y6_SALTM|nr:hypothetical protein [Salmonella enterica subsp. enterica serovar Typhimurium var. 5-]ECS9114761.1 hypothetical protein [Salmonella enterica subsp. enterica serovar Typhimurium]
MPFSCRSRSAQSTNWQSGNLTKCALIQTHLRFVCRAVCDAQKTEKRREFSGRDRMCNCNTVTRDAITIAIWSGVHPDTPLA